MLFGHGPPGIDYSRDPYAALARLQDTAPRYHAPERDAWFFSARADIAALLRDDRLAIVQGSTFADRSDAFRTSVVRRLRSWFASSATLLAQTVSAVTQDSMAALARQGGGDLVPAVAHAVPARVMAALLGIPTGDLLPLQRVAADLLLSYDLDWDGRPEAAVPAPRVLGLYLQEHWRSAPATPLMVLLRDTQAEFDLSHASMIDTCSKLFSAGTTTTGACIANILARLLGAAGPQTATDGIEDMLRLHTPLLAITRQAVAEVQLGDAVIRPGQKVYLLVGSANRADSDARAAPSLSFGLGRYHCLGAALARREIAALLDAFHAVAPQMRLSGPVQWRESWLLHEARSIPVTIHGVFDAD